MLAALLSTQAVTGFCVEYTAVGGSTTWTTSHTNDGAMDILGTLNNISVSNSALKNNGTILIHSAGTLYSDGQIDNHNILTNAVGGTLKNNGTITTYVGSTITNAGSLVNGTPLATYAMLDLNSTMNNTGTLDNHFYLLNHGVLNNSGTLNSTNLLSVGTLNNTGALNNSGTVWLNNPETLTNSGAGTYTQSAGSIVNDATITTATPLAINGGSLSGNGIINGNVVIASGATVMPGDSLGILTINGDLTSSGNYNFEIGDVATPLFDQLIVNGAATFAPGAVTFDFVNNFSATKGDHWDFLTATSLDGFNNLTFGVTGLDSSYWKIETNGGIATLTITGPDNTVTTPEPSTYLLLLLSLACLAAVKVKMGKKSQLAVSP